MSREMKDSGIERIGKIPLDWDIIRYKWCCTIQNGFAFDSSNFSNEGFPIIRIRDITSGSTETFYSGDYSEEYVVHKNDCLIGMDGDFNIRMWEGPDALLNQRCCRLFEKNNYNRKFLFYSLPFCLNEINSLTYSTTVKHLSADDIKKSHIAIPNKEEQSIISNHIDRLSDEIDSIIKKTKQTIEEYKKLKQSIITEAVTKGIRKNRKMKDSGIEWIAEIPENWNVTRLKYEFNFGKGLPITKENLVEKGLPVISYGQIHSKINIGIEYRKEMIRFVEKSYEKTNPDSIVHTGDFIFADTSEDLEGCGNNVYCPSDELIFAGYHSIILKSIKKQDNSYYAYLFKTDYWRSQIRSRAFGVKLFSVTKKIISETTLITPPIGEQEEITSYLKLKCNTIDKAIEKKLIYIDELETYRKTLIYEYVTGKKEVDIE